MTKFNGHATRAYANSACDVQNGTEIFNVGPPQNESEYPSNARNPRTPSDRSGGLGGLQMSLHIGEWWQGLFFEPMSGSSYDWPDWWNPNQFGSYSVTTRNNNGTDVPAFGPQGPWDRFRPRPGMMLQGGGSQTAGMYRHGAGDDARNGERRHDGVPGTRQERRGGGLLLAGTTLRAAREHRGALRARPESTVRHDGRFWDWWDTREPMALQPIPNIEGGPFPPIFPYEDYEGPYPLMRRGEFALFTVGEFAAPDQGIQPIPWDTPQFQVGTGTDRRAELMHFVDDATRPRPFGGETMILRNNTGVDFGVEECLEIAPAGWDAATGTFNPKCPDPWTSDTRFTGIVNHENNGAGQTVRPIEVGRRDNREAIGTATTRRLVGREPELDPGRLRLVRAQEGDSRLPDAAGSIQRPALDEHSRGQICYKQTSTS